MHQLKFPFGRLALETLEWLMQCPALRPRTRIIVVGFGKPVDVRSPFPYKEEPLKMILNKGQRVPIIETAIVGKTADGQDAAFDPDTKLRYESSDPVAVPIVEDAGRSYLYLMEQGSSVITAFADGDRTAGTRDVAITLGSMTVNDPAKEAVAGELPGGANSAFGEPEPIPAGGGEGEPQL